MRGRSRAPSPYIGLSVFQQVAFYTGKRVGAFAINDDGAAKLSSVPTPPSKFLHLPPVSIPASCPLFRRPVAHRFFSMEARSFQRGAGCRDGAGQWRVSA